MQTKISVVIPTYQRPALLRKCLTKLSEQTFSTNDYEIIVVTDGPDDLSADTVSEFKNSWGAKFQLLSLPVRKGPAAARNLGWKNGLGILIAFTDDDCLPAKNWLQKIWEHYKGEEKIVFTGKVIVPVSEKPTDFELNTKGLEKGEFVTANCTCTKAALFAVDGFDEAFTIAWREDSDLHFKLLKQKIPIVKLNDAIVTHPVRKAPWGISIREQRKSMFNALLYKKYPDLYRQRIRSGPNRQYYFILLFFSVFFIATCMDRRSISAVSAIGWLLLTGAFTINRLSVSRKSPGHVFEMIVTSVAIPFLSVFWTIAGSIKYRVLFF